MERGMNERVRKLRKQSMEAVPHIDIERAKLITEAYKKYEGSVSIPELRAIAFKYYMENRTLCINEDELIVGEKGDSPQASPTFPELCCHTLEDMDVMDSRDIIFFKVDDKTREFHKEEIIPYWENRSLRHKILNNIGDEWKRCYEAGIFTEFMEQRGPGHTVGGDLFYKKGFLQLKQEAQNSIDRLDFMNDREALSKKHQLEAMKIACDAIIIYAKRCSEYAREMAEKEENTARKQELLTIAHNCEVVPANPPQNYYQAIQMYWFVHIGVTTELNPWDAFSPGRLDQHLYPFYKVDVAEGSLDDDKALELLECLGKLEVLVGAELRQLAVDWWFFGFFFKAFAGFVACFFAGFVFFLFALATVQVLFEVGFTHAQRGEWAAFGGLVNHDVGHDALSLDRLARRCVVTGGGDLQPGVRPQRAYGLHRALAEGLGTHDGGAFVVLQRTGHDFAGGRRAFIHQHDQRH